MPTQSETERRTLPPHNRLTRLRLGHAGWMAQTELSCGTLGEVVKAEGPLKLGDALAVFYQVAGMAVYLHDHGVLHGNLQPELIFRGGAQHCHLGVPDEEMSTGDREFLARQNRTWRAFAAPEIAQGTVPDSRCDVYSLGVLLHWLLIGKVPSGGPSRRLPVAIASLIQRAIERDPDKRSQTISSLVDGLQAIDREDLLRYESELQLAVSAAGFDPRLLWSRHPRKVLASIGIIALVIAGSAWGYRKFEASQAARYAAVEQETRQQARDNSLRRRHDRAAVVFENGQYRDAIELYEGLVRENLGSGRREVALAQIARSHGALEDYGAEYAAWLRLLREFPDSSAGGEANDRLVRIAALALKRYGHLTDVTTKQDIIEDGLANDWTGIEPLIVDPVGDNARGGPASDLTALYVAVKGEKIYFRFDFAAPPNEGDQYCVAIDLNAFAYDDSTEEWDYQIGVARGIAPWIWDLRGSRSYENTTSIKLQGVTFAQAQCVEFSLPLAAIGSPTSIGVRAFTNYAGMRQANDVVRRKMLIKWEREKPELMMIDPEQKVGKNR